MDKNRLFTFRGHAGCDILLSDKNGLVRVFLHIPPTLLLSATWFEKADECAASRTEDRQHKEIEHGRHGLDG